MNCPICQKELVVVAENDDEAMMKMKDEAKKHMGEVHPEAEMKSDEEMDKMIRDSWTKE
ncbi:hypothetical protein HYZ70_04065 [Candidatus Curtissbacteria bacterium]|nr:hypothetical protein [Candidatus Curtissbacteria bacterium]